MSSPSKHSIAAVLAVTACLSLAAVASAGTLHTNRKCYTHYPASHATTVTQPIVVGITGGWPGSGFILSAGSTARNATQGGAGSVDGDFNADGNAITALTNVFPPHTSIGPLKGEKLHLAVTDYVAGHRVVVATGMTRITNVAMRVGLPRLHPFRKGKITLSGLTPLFGRHAIYGTYTKGWSGKGRTVKRIKLGKPKNPCGYMQVRRRIPPRPGYRKWTLYVHVGKKLKRSRSLIYKFRIYRRYF